MSGAPAFEDPDGLLDGTDPVDVPTIHKAQLEPGEKVDTPWQPGDPLDLPEVSRPRSGLLKPVTELFGGRTPEEMIDLLRVVPTAKGEPTVVAPEPENDPEEQRRERLRYLARWAGPTEHAQQLYDAAQKLVDEWPSNNPKSKTVPKLHLATLARRRVTLDDCLERDRIKAARDPKCHCLGSGGYDDEVAIMLIDPATADKPVWEQRGVYCEGMNGPLTWSRTCEHCPEGQVHLAWVEQQREELRLRHAAIVQRRILGVASIPERYEHLTLETYPDAVAAGRSGSWYLRVLGEIPIPRGVNFCRSLLIHGPNRRGKTGLGVGVQKLAIARGIPAVFRTMRDLLAGLRRAYGKDVNTTFDEVLEALKDAPLLIIDDLGAERLMRGDTWIAEVLYGLLDHRATHNLPTIITSNLGWTESPEARERRAKAHGSLEDKAWKRSDYDPEEMLDYVGERLWWRIDSMTNKLPLFGPVLGYGPEPVPFEPDPSDEL